MTLESAVISYRYSPSNKETMLRLLDRSYEGLDGREIKCARIPYTSFSLKDGECIINEDGDILLFCKRYNSYILCNTDEQSFLPNESILQKWEKVKKETVEELF